MSKRNEEGITKYDSNMKGQLNHQMSAIKQDLNNAFSEQKTNK